MNPHRVNKTIAEINEKIRKGKAVVVTAEEIIDIVAEKGPVKAALEVDVVTTGTFGPMCSSGAFMNFGHSQPRIKAAKVWLNNVPVFAGIAFLVIATATPETYTLSPHDALPIQCFHFAGAHKEFGGTISAKNAGALTIPISPLAKGKRAGEFNNTFLRKGIIWQGYERGRGKKKSGGIRPLFVLKKSVSQRAEPWWPQPEAVLLEGEKIAAAQLEREMKI